MAPALIATIPNVFINADQISLITADNTTFYATVINGLEGIFVNRSGLSNDFDISVKDSTGKEVARIKSNFVLSFQAGGINREGLQELDLSVSFRFLGPFKSTTTILQNGELTQTASQPLTTTTTVALPWGAAGELTMTEFNVAATGLSLAFGPPPGPPPR